METDIDHKGKRSNNQKSRNLRIWGIGNRIFKEKKMKVAELINILLEMPQDADVYRFNESCDCYYSDTEEMVSEVKKDEYDLSITIK